MNVEVSALFFSHGDGW